MRSKHADERLRVNAQECLAATAVLASPANTRVRRVC